MDDAGSLPGRLDSSVIGFGLTYWPEPDRKYLIQHSRDGAVPCFEVIRGRRSRIEPSFDPDALYLACLRCIRVGLRPDAGGGRPPSLSIGIAADDARVYLLAGAEDEAWAAPDVAALRSDLDAMLGRSGRPGSSGGP